MFDVLMGVAAIFLACWAWTAFKAFRVLTIAALVVVLGGAAIFAGVMYQDAHKVVFLGKVTDPTTNKVTYDYRLGNCTRTLHFDRAPTQEDISYVFSNVLPNICG